MTITSRDVKSSTVASIAHDDATRVLTVRFRTPGGVPAPDEYRHAGVPRSVYDQLAGEALRVQSGYPGASVGKMFHQLVRGKYPTTKISAMHTVTQVTDDQRTRLKQDLALALVAAEKAFRCCERGMDLQETLREIEQIALYGETPRSKETEQAARTLASAGADPFALSTDALRGV